MSTARRDAREARGRQGFTMTEMLVALFLASVGMVTVFGIQVAANVVQRQARDINAARVLGESFMTQLRGETVNWTTPFAAVDCNAAEMPLCFNAINSAEGAPGTWIAVPNTARDASPRFNALGIPLDDADSRVVSGPDRDRLNQYNQRYCINYNLDLVGNSPAPGELMRAHVRVFWPITEDAFSAAAGGVPDCGWSDPTDMADAVLAGKFRFVQITSVLYRHEDLL